MMQGAQKWCSTQMRDVLIEHMDGAKVEMHQPVSDGLDAVAQAIRLKVFNALLARGMIKLDRRERSDRYTTITEAGREALAIILGDWADALRRSGFEVVPTNRGPVSDMRREQLELRVALISGESRQPPALHNDLDAAYPST